jgi:DNA-binding response OmpR family regulator
MTEPVKTRVVIADDDADIRALVGIAVHKAGLDLVSVAWDGDTAWEDIQEHRPDLAVLDVSMPGKTGLEVSRLVRADPTLSGTTIVLLSAAVDEASRNAGIEAGALEYLAKPFSPKDLAARLAFIVTVLK